ncbi:hypothetical protein J7F02_16480 [Streptomyces sp. ISL-112]|uniref:hypothetical protein n=1 Tax=unclassified Streptomyces TaxID=2593676 RepID=UPI001BECB3B2|nr:MULTISPECIES: hypothetical protein [unclassified Streptomyces]MBT2427223.1 hypothetical protein [Streptomyces sp. ISL-112]MBT2465767.1 hypothetical protein [Streptomyces sp. ISL-63]
MSARRYRRLSWRYLAHRTGLVLSLSLLYADVPFSNRWHRRRILARKQLTPERRQLSPTTQPEQYRMFGRANAALAAADQLARQGHHVHFVASGETRCHTGHCTPKDTL